MPAEQLIAGKPAALVFTYENPSGARTATFGITIFNQLGVAVTHMSMHLAGYEWTDIGTKGEVRCEIPRLPFPIGQYRVAAGIRIGQEHADLIPNILLFDVVSSTFYPSGHTPQSGFCAMMMDHSFSH